MNPGKLRHKIEIQADRGTERDANGGDIPGWQTIIRARANVETLQGRELAQAQQANAETTTRIVMRYRPGITPKHRVKFGARILDINSAIDPEGRRIELHLMCKEAVE